MNFSVVLKVHESEAEQKLVDTWSSQTNMLLGVLIECKAVDPYQQKAFFLSSTNEFALSWPKTDFSVLNRLCKRFTENERCHNALEEQLA
jgi:hypothetical protein